MNNYKVNNLLTFVFSPFLVLHPLLVHNALYQPVQKVKQYLAAEVRSRSKLEKLTDDRRWEAMRCLKLADRKLMRARDLESSWKSGRDRP